MQYFEVLTKHKNLYVCYCTFFVERVYCMNICSQAVVHTQYVYKSHTMAVTRVSVTVR